MYVRFLALRYLLRRRFSALGTLAAVVFGVATFFTVLSVMEGYRVKLRELVRGLESHLTVLGIPSLSLKGAEELEEVIRAVPHVAATAPFIETVAMYRTFGRFSYFQLKGIDPLAEAGVGDLESHLLRPEELRAIFPQAEEGAPGRPELERRVVEALGPGRAPLSPEEIEKVFSRERRLEVMAEADPAHAPRSDQEVPAGLVVGINLLLDREVFLGDEVKVILLSPRTGQPVLESLVVVGAFKSGEFETDSRAALVRVEKLRSLLGLFDPATGEPLAEGIRVALDDYRHAEEARAAIVAAVGRRAARAGLEGLLRAAEEAVRFEGERMEALVRDSRNSRIGATAKDAGDGAPAVSEEEARLAAREAAAVLASPRAREEAHRRAWRAAEESMASFSGRYQGLISEAFVLRDAREAVTSAWQDLLLEGANAPGRSEATALAARAVFRAATRDLGAAFHAQPQDPFAAEVRTWEDRQQVLLQAVKREKRIVGFLVILINAFIACLILLMLVLLVIEKTRDIGILLALGATSKGVVAIFLAGGLCITALGTALGMGAGWLFVENINVIHDAIFAATGYRLFDPETYKMDRLPTTFSPADVLWSMIPSVVFGLLASLVPAIWASRQDPIKAIHYE